VTSLGRVMGYESDYHYKILLVDDRWENLSVIRNLLEPIGFEITEAANGQEGLEKAHSLQPDLVITDLAMPIMNGFEMVKQMRESETLNDKIILASSASVFDFHRQEARTAGCNDFIPKPVQAEELLSQLQQYLQLTWVYENATLDRPDVTVSQKDENPWTVPEIAHLQPLYAAVQRCRVTEIQAIAKQIKEFDSKYSSFADKVFTLAEQFDIDAIAALIEPYL
jgi:CheY-like chemotaxis protein